MRGGAMKKTRARAFIEQAKSDLAAYRLLNASPLPTCHRLHYLQMWLEKLCKAHLWSPNGSADELRMTHNVVGKILPQLINQYWRRIGFTNRPDLTPIRELCREVDLLHPQVDAGGSRPDNVEYPWLDNGGDANAPADWSFPLAARLHQPPGRLLLKAATALTDTPLLLPVE